MTLLVDKKGNQITADKDQVEILKKAGWKNYGEVEQEIISEGADVLGENDQGLNDAEEHAQDLAPVEPNVASSADSYVAPLWHDGNGVFVELSDVDYKKLTAAEKKAYTKEQQELKDAQKTTKK